MGRGNFQQLIIPIIWVGFACIHQNAPSTFGSFLPPDFILPNSQAFLLPLEGSARNLSCKRPEVAQRESWELLAGVIQGKAEPSPCLCACRNNSANQSNCKSGSSLLPRFPGLSHCTPGLAASPSTEQVPRDATKATKDIEYK